LFRLERHAKRLSNSAKYLNYTISSKKIQETLVEFVQRNQCQKSFYIRPLVYNSTLGITPKIQEDSDLLIYGLELEDYLPPEGVRCSIASWYRQEDRSLPLRGKITGTYITSCLAKTEALSRGFDEALLMNANGKVSEASGMNLFLVRDGKLITPGVDQDILEGITRDSIIQIAREDFGLEVIERSVDKTELFVADEVFLSGTAAKITPIKQIEQFELPTDRPITDKLKNTLVEITLGRYPKYEAWVDRIQI
jgi:branched-chain amino acid aminotransferase